MSDPARNKELLRGAYARWQETKGGSVDDWMKLLADDITFGSIAEGLAPATFTARVRGKERLKGFFEGLQSGWEMIYFTVHHYVAEGDRVVAIITTSWRNKATGKVCETPKVDVWRFPGRARHRTFQYSDTARMMAAAT